MTNIIPLQAVEIEINHACNRSCSYCPNSVTERQTKGIMSLDLFDKILKNLMDIFFTGRISFNFYNEPLLHPQIGEFVLRTKKLLPQVKIQIYSNGTLLTLEKFRNLIAAGVDEFKITRHEADINSEHYAFEKTFQALTVKEKSQVKYISYQQLRLVNRGGLLKHIADKGLDLHPCYIPNHMILITVDGRVLSCFEDYNENLIFGDLKNEKLIDIWQKDSYKQFRGNLQKGLRHLHKPCNECSRKESLPPFDI